MAWLESPNGLGASGRISIMRRSVKLNRKPTAQFRLVLMENFDPADRMNFFAVSPPNISAVRIRIRSVGFVH